MKKFVAGVAAMKGVKYEIYANSKEEADDILSEKMRNLTIELPHGLEPTGNVSYLEEVVKKD